MDVLESVFVMQIIYQVASLSVWVVDRKTWTFKKSRLLEFYTVVVILAASAFTLNGLFTDDDFIKTNDSNIGQTVDFIQIVGIRIAHIVSILEALVKKEDQKKFYEELKEIDRIFECSLNVDVNNKKHRRHTLKHALVMLIIYLTSELFILASKLISKEHNFFLFWIFYLLPLIVCGLRYFQMLTSIRTIKWRFDELVKVLHTIHLPKNSKRKVLEYKGKPFEDLPKDILKNAPLTLAVIESSIQKQRCCDMENPELKKLLIIRDLYNRLFALTETVNRCFGVSILINVGNDFISITSNCYWIFINFKDFSATNSDFLQISSSAVWSVPHLLNVLVLAILCEKTVKSTTNIALGLHRIDIDVLNDNHNAVIEQFSLQLLHQKMSITAAGFFSIDCTLLYTIVGATTTYLIILIQFHLNESKS